MLAVRTSGSTCKPLNRATATLSGRLSATSAGTNRSAEFLAPGRPLRRRVAGDGTENRGRHGVYVGRRGAGLVKAVLLRRGIPGQQLGLEIGADLPGLGDGEAPQPELSVGADEDVLRADAQMQNPRRVQGGQRGHQRHEQRTHLVPAQPPARLGQSGLQGNTLAVFSHRVGRMVLLENVVQRNDGRQIPHPGQRPRVAAELAEIIGEGVLASAENLQLPGVSPGA